VLTQVVVDRNDPAPPSRPCQAVGPFLSRAAADEKTPTLRLGYVEEQAAGFRRVVLRAEPLEIIEEDLVRRLLQQGFLPMRSAAAAFRSCGLNGDLKVVDAV